VVGIATGYGMDEQGVGVRVLVRSRVLPALGPTQPPIQWVPGVLSPGREADPSLPTSAEAIKYGSIHPLPHTPSWRSA
jgi:hypothetical protein